MRRSKNLVALALLAVLVLSAATAANALTLTLSVSGGPSVTAVDNVSNDSNPTLGAVTFIGALGQFSVNVTTGVSKPVLAPVDMDLNSVNVNSGGAGILTITLTDTGFVLPAGSYSLNSAIGGTLTAPAGSSVNAEQCIGTSCPGTAAVIHPPLGPGAFSDTRGVGFTTDGSPFALTESVVINFTGAGNVSFDLESHVPEPSVLMLLGTGLVSMAAAPAVSRRWRSRRASK